MIAMNNRLAAVEARQPTCEKVHLVHWHADRGQTEDEAIDKYSPDLIGRDDLKIMLKFVSPKFGDSGNRVLLTPDNQCIRRGENNDAAA